MEENLAPTLPPSSAGEDEELLVEKKGEEEEEKKIFGLKKIIQLNSIVTRGTNQNFGSR